LAKTRDKEAADGGDDVASGALPCHGSKVPRLRARRNSHQPQQCDRRVLRASLIPARDGDGHRLPLQEDAAIRRGYSRTAVASLPLRPRK
jgi:hypothetical protein